MSEIDDAIRALDPGNDCFDTLAEAVAATTAQVAALRTRSARLAAWAKRRGHHQDCRLIGCVCGLDELLADRGGT